MKTLINNNRVDTSNIMDADEKRAQTTFEYLFLAVGVIIFIVLVYLLLQGNILGGQSDKIPEDVEEFLKVGEYFLFFDNFDSNTAERWSPQQDSWRVLNKEYVQTDNSDFQKSTYAGSSGWVNYYADTEIQFTSLPAEAGILGGIAGRVNKNTGARYVCAFDLTSAADPKEGKIRLFRFTDWQSYAILSSSPTFEIDTIAHAIAIQANGNDIKCFWDAEEILTYNDATPFKFGMLALEQRLTETHFDTVRAKYQNGPDPIGPAPTEIIITGSPTPIPSPIFISGTPTVIIPSPSIPVLKCSDGTPYGECSSTQPLYCDSGTLIEKCSLCDCPAESPYCSFDQNCTAATSIQITNVSNSTITQTTAWILWDTSITANGTIEYGLNESYGGNRTHNNSLLSHALQIQSLSANMLYHYRISSCNGASCNVTGDFNFTTAPAPFCVDSDDSQDQGFNPDIYGNGTNLAGTFWDECTIPQPTFDRQVEHYCGGSTLRTAIANCDNCTAGVCAGSFCLDLGNRVYTDNGRFTDGCDPMDENHIDYLCDGFLLDTIITECEQAVT